MLELQLKNRGKNGGIGTITAGYGTSTGTGGANTTTTAAQLGMVSTAATTASNGGIPATTTLDGYFTDSSTSGYHGLGGGGGHQPQITISHPNGHIGKRGQFVDTHDFYDHLGNLVLQLCIFKFELANGWLAMYFTFENYYGIPSPPKKHQTIHNLEIEFQSNYTTAKAEKIVQLRRQHEYIYIHMYLCIFDICMYLFHVFVSWKKPVLEMSNFFFDEKQQKSKNLQHDKKN